MKLILLCSIIATVIGAPRQKRLTVGTIAVSGGVGGSAGCVVTGNVLYANGFKLRDLTQEEQKELNNYQSQVEQYKSALKQAVKERQEHLKARMAGKKVKAVETSSDDLPKAPKKPSFCSADDTTQFYFDGCMVQNNKVYVGQTYARDLSPDEVQQLKVFEKKQTAYQDYVQKQVQQQVSNLFGGSDFFSSFFNGDSKASTTTEAPALPEEAPEQPTVPNFCTPIY
ncbi:pepsin inhibitor-3-like repeated domain protein [Dictyocaulus viviparus]|uniref:Pepsin inhibitor-3-like repeated domain protein n=1 Tax=Dictyocaulus viviparus TaxID=29172 RepID=A0A0D8XDA3_DICVI|nr:pepsin inhibitor-3-like repeated domain protein [Dictyocaulus viviparus]